MAKRKRTNNNLQNTPQKTSLVITASTITSAQNSEVSGITSCVQRDMQITCGLIFELGLCKVSCVEIVLRRYRHRLMKGFTLGLSRVCVAQSLVFCVVFCRSLFVLFPLAVVLCVLVQFNLRLLIAPLLSSSFSFSAHNIVD